MTKALDPAERAHRKREYEKAYRSKPENRERHRRYVQEYFKKPENIARRDAHRQKRQAQHRDADAARAAKQRAAVKAQVFDKLGRCCKRCGFDDVRALQIDHVRGNGTQDRRETPGPVSYLKKVLADTTGAYQILCANCNWIKRAENKEQGKSKGRRKKTDG